MLRGFELHPEAEEEFDESIVWYANHSESAGERFVEATFVAIRTLQEFPEAGTPDLYGTRHFRVTAFPFQLIYRERLGLLQVIAVAHTSRKPGYWRKRL